jgi:hypothetical protein
LLLLAVWGVGNHATGAEPPRKLIFIHHSCGQNWLADENGGLAKALARHRYFVSDTNYGWGPDGIGDRTDIPDWPEWFCGPESPRILEAVLRESGVHSPYSRSLADPGGRNRIILFKSCFPNSALEGSPDDPPGRGEGLSVGGAKAVYVKLREAFAERPDLFFVAITAPPLIDSQHAGNARAFNTWLTKEWLKDYSGNNIMVFDFYNVLTASGNHHRLKNGEIEYVNDAGGDTLAYPSDDDHPSVRGNRKATEEFVPLLNYHVARWWATAPASAPPKASSESREEEETPEPAVEAETVAPATPPETPPVGDMSSAANLAAAAEGWEVFQDESVQKPMMTISRKEMGGISCLSVAYRVNADTWAACAKVQEGPLDWSDYQGVAVRYRAPAGCRLILTVYEHAPDGGLLHFECPLPEGSESWQNASLTWDAFRQPEWQGEADRRFKPNRSRGLALILHPADAPVSGTFYIAEVGPFSKESQ